jgi:NADPH:quinone reductase-like Zn-dependent oxidoreductase
MRAISQRSFGGPEVLRLVDVDRPVPLPTEVLVRVQAAGVNPVDGMIRSGALPLLGEPPFTLGWDIAGVVEEVGPGVTRFAPGDPVFGMPLFPRQAGGYAEFVAAPSRQLAAIPPGTDPVHAAALPLAGLTAWQALVEIAGLQAGQHVLVHAAAGGVGHLAVQLAVARGAVVSATTSAAKMDLVTSLGARTVVDYRQHDFAEVVGSADVVLDLVGGAYGDRSIPILRPGGILVSVRGEAAVAERAAAAGRRYAAMVVEPDGAGLEALAALVTAGSLAVRVQKTFALEEAAAAHRLVDASPGSGTGRGLAGKLVLTL